MTQKIKIFLDGADRKTMVEMAALPEVQGFTTNPSLMRKSGVTDYPGFCKEILTQLKGKPVSFEVFADDLAGMRSQAKQIATWGSSIYVKIPVMNSKGESTASLVKELSRAGVKLNVTAIFTLKQVWETCQALEGGAPSIVSVFAGRLADAGRDPLPMIEASAAMCKETGPQVELLWASTREVYNIVQAELGGCQIITAPADLIRKLAHFGKDPYTMSLETVRTFKTDSEAAGFQL